jgi:membrane-anchored mycosin MYCP
MSIPAPEVRIGERYDSTQIVVDLEQCQVVTELLAHAGFQKVTWKGDLPKLRLSLLSVEGLSEGLAALPDQQKLPGHGDLPDRAELIAQLTKNRERLGLSDGPSDLDVLLLLLRLVARGRYAGWTPVMGKNRDVEAIGGLPHIGVREEEPPEKPMTKVVIPARPDSRGRRLRVGVLDTGVYPDGQLTGRYVTDDFINSKEPFQTWQGHATFVAGRILMRAPGADLDMQRVLEDDGRATSWALAERMASFLGSGVEILNLSIGGATADGEPPLVLERAADVLSAEMLLVAAAGNHGNPPQGNHGDPPQQVSKVTDDLLRTEPPKPNSPLWPAALHNVVAVGATDEEDRIARFTPPGVPWLDLVAPGAHVESTFLTGDVQAVTVDMDGDTEVRRTQPLGRFQGAARWSGTSFATADATGEIARLSHDEDTTAQEALATIRDRAPGQGDVHRPW